MTAGYSRPVQPGERRGLRDKRRPLRATPGTVTNDGRPMKYAHGQHAAYVLDRCRCALCRQANREHENVRSQRVEPAYVGADPARQHVRFLAEQGIGLKTVAKQSGVPHGSLSKLMYGDPQRGMAPSKRIRRKNLEAILAVMPADAADDARIDAGPTWVLLDEMIAAGVPKARLAELLGQRGPGLQLRRTTVHARNARRVREIHADWVAGRLELRARGHRNVETPAVVAPPKREPDYIDRSAVLLDLAELLEARLEQPWRRDAACRNRPPHIWFPAPGDQRCVDAAKKICRACIVRSQCLAANLDEDVGVYGGLTGYERRELRRIELAS